MAQKNSFWSGTSAQSNSGFGHNLDENTGSLQKGECSTPWCEGNAYTLPLADVLQQCHKGQQQ